MAKLILRRGPNATMPVLENGEMNYVYDREKLVVGKTGSGNVVVRDVAPWKTGLQFEIDDLTLVGNLIWRCTSPHLTSGVNFGDVDADKWAETGRRGTVVVSNISQRDALTAPVLYDTVQALVLDATGDTSVQAGAALYVWTSAAWVKLTEYESMDLTTQAGLSANQLLLTDTNGKIVSVAKGTALNASFGLTAGDVLEIATSVTALQALELDATGKVVSVAKGTVDHANFGLGVGDVPAIGATHLASRRVETDANGKLITVAKGTADNADFGTGTTNVPAIGATLVASRRVETDTDGKIISVVKNSADNVNFAANNTATAGAAVEATDSRLANMRTPVDASVTIAKLMSTATLVSNQLFASVAGLPAATAGNSTMIAFVVNGAVPGESGVYRSTGAAWVKIMDSVGNRSQLWDVAGATVTYSPTDAMASGTLVIVGNIIQQDAPFDGNPNTFAYNTAGGPLDNTNAIGKQFLAPVVSGKVLLRFWNAGAGTQFQIQGLSGGSWTAIPIASISVGGTIVGGNTFNLTESHIAIGVALDTELILNTSTGYDGVRIMIIAGSMNLGTLSVYEALPVGLDIDAVISLNKVRAMVQDFGVWIDNGSGLSAYDYAANAVVKHGAQLFKNISGSTVAAGSSTPVDGATWQVLSPVAGIYSTAAALDAAYPAASNSGRIGFVYNSPTPGVADGLYRSNGSSWSNVLPNAFMSTGDRTALWEFAYVTPSYGVINVLGGAGTVTCDAGSTNPANAFDGGDSTFINGGALGSVGPNQWVAKEIGAAIVPGIAKLATFGWDNLALQIQGWNGSSWDVVPVTEIISTTGPTSPYVGAWTLPGSNIINDALDDGTATVRLNTNTAYNKFRLYCVSGGGRIGEFQIFEKLPIGANINCTSAINKLHDMSKNFSEWIDNGSGLSAYGYAANAVVLRNGLIWHNKSGATILAGNNPPAAGATWEQLAPVPTSAEVTAATYTVTSYGREQLFRVKYNGAVTFNLPAISNAAVLDGDKIIVRDIGRNGPYAGAGTNNISIVPNGTEKVANDAGFVLSSNDESQTFVANKTYGNWEIT